MTAGSGMGFVRARDTEAGTTDFDQSGSTNIILMGAKGQRNTINSVHRKKSCKLFSFSLRIPTPNLQEAYIYI